MRTVRRRHERGVTVPFLALSLVALLGFAGLVVDGAHAFAERRQMQNAADAGALAGANALNRYLVGTGAADDIEAAAVEAAGDNGIDAADVVCELVRTNGSTRACPNTSNGLAVPTDAFTVRASVDHRYGTTFMRVLGTDEFEVAGSAAAAVQAVTTGTAPFMVCGIDDDHPIPLLVEQSGVDPALWPLNTAAIGEEYAIWGNDVRLTDCGNPSSSFRGLVDTDAGPYSLPGWWEGDQGNKNGPIMSLVLSNNACTGDLPAVGCEMILPICAAGNGGGGNNFEMYCTRFGGFRITHVANHDMDAEFIGAVTVVDGEGEGAPEPGEARVIRLVE